MAEDEQGTVDDLSAGELAPEIRSLDTQLIKEQKLLFNFKRYAFWGAATISFTFFSALLYYIFCIPSPLPSERLTIVGVLGAIPTIITLALLRYAFASHQDNRFNNNENYSLWQSFLKELTILIKGLAEKKL